MLSTLRRHLHGLGGPPGVVLIGASALLVLGHYRGSTIYFSSVFGARVAGHPAHAALPYFWWFASSPVLYLAAPLLLSRLAGLPFTRRFGLGLGNVRAGLSLCGLFLAAMLPLVFLAAQLRAFEGHYPLAGQGAFSLAIAGGKTRVSLPLFALYEACYLLYFVGWEFFFRGWMLNALLPRFGRAGAVLIPVLPFALMHLGKPELEAFGSIAAGVALGVLALRVRSFWYGALVHGVVAVTMDVLASRAYLFPR